MASKTLPERQQCAVQDPLEREAVALLYQAGWTLSELGMVFECGENSIRRLLDAEGIDR